MRAKIVPRAESNTLPRAHDVNSGVLIVALDGRWKATPQGHDLAVQSGGFTPIQGKLLNFNSRSVSGGTWLHNARVPFELVIFDCDGVLVDTERISHQLLVDMLCEAGVMISMDTALELFLGKSIKQSTAVLVELLGEMKATQLMSNFLERIKIVFKSQLHAVPGIRAALDKLTIPYCVASSGDIEKMRITLRATGLSAYFDDRLTSVTEVAEPKPAPDVYLLAASKQNVLPEHCLVIEDSPIGVKAAVAARMTVFGYSALTPAQVLLDAGAKRIFHSMLDLPGMISPECPP